MYFLYKVPLNWHPAWKAVWPLSVACSPPPAPKAFGHNLCFYHGYSYLGWGIIAQSFTHFNGKKYWFDYNSSLQKHTSMNFKQLWEFLFKHTHRWQATSIRDTWEKKGVGIEKESLAMSSWNRSNELKINLGLRSLLLHLGEQLKGICFSWKLVWAELWLYNSIFGGRELKNAYSAGVCYKNGNFPTSLFAQGPQRYRIL